MSMHQTATAPLSGESLPHRGILVEGCPETAWTCDPLEPDAEDDEIVVTSVRRLLRVAIAAADAGARFGRERLNADPAAWMITPRALFDGLPAIQACQDLEHFSRSIVLHGLGLGLDADPIEVDALLADGEADPDRGAGAAEAADHEASAADDNGVDPTLVRLPSPLLLTCWIDADDARGRLFAFCGVVTDRPVELVDRVIGRYGAAAAAAATFAVGYDHRTPLATAMISEAMAHTLAMAAEDPASPLARGLDLAVEQRFAA